MKFRQLSFKSFQKSKSKKKKSKEPQPTECTTQTNTIETSDNIVSFDNCAYFDDAINTSIRSTLRRYKTTVTPRNKYVISNRQSALSDDENDNGLLYELEDIDKVLCTVRKERTRIKTNPWIPPRKSLHENDLADLIPEGANPEDYLNVCILAEEAGKAYSETGDTRKTDTKVTKRVKRELNLSEVNVNRWSIISEGDITIDLNSPTIEDLNERFANIDYAIDFKYEENIDNLLDDEVTARQAKRLSINDLLDDYCCEETSDLSNSSMEISDNTSCSGSDITSCSGSDSSSCSGSEGCPDSQVPNKLTKFSNGSSKMDESIDAGYSSLSRDSCFPHSSDSDSTEPSESESEGEENLTLVGNKNFIDTQRACEASDSERTLPDIRSSLQEKVNQLRAEKIIVEEKIREAQEDDKIRHKETQRFRKHLPVYKKQVLLKTLNSLKERLETQSQRLQKSYTTVLSMQRRFTHRHNPLSIVPNIH